jgi:muramoyltetrapeptide carboxypeptidase
MKNSNGLSLSEYYPVIDESKNISNLQFTINSGIASGKMLGGNLSILTSLVGSPYIPDFTHSILFVEDVSELQLYKLDRMFSQLENAGVLNKISGFVFASCYGCNLSSAGYATLMQILDRYIKPLHVPAYAGSMIGHFDSKFTVPIGVNVQIDADKHEVKLLQSATIN